MTSKQLMRSIVKHDESNSNYDSRMFDALASKTGSVLLREVQVHHLMGPLPQDYHFNNHQHRIKEYQRPRNKMQGNDDHLSWIEKMMVASVVVEGNTMPMMVRKLKIFNIVKKILIMIPSIMMSTLRWSSPVRTHNQIHRQILLPQPHSQLKKVVVYSSYVDFAPQMRRKKKIEETLRYSRLR